MIYLACIGSKTYKTYNTNSYAIVALLFDFFLQPREIALKQRHVRLHEPLHAPSKLLILRQLIPILQLHIHIVGQLVLFVAVPDIFGVDVARIAETGYIVVALVQAVVVVQQVSPEDVNFVLQFGGYALFIVHCSAKHLKTFYFDKDALGLKVFASNCCRNSSDQILSDFYICFLFEEFHHLEGSSINRNILHIGIVLISRTVDLQR